MQERKSAGCDDLRRCRFSTSGTNLNHVCIRDRQTTNIENQLASGVIGNISHLAFAHVSIVQFITNGLAEQIARHVGVVVGVVVLWQHLFDVIDGVVVVSDGHVDRFLNLPERTDFALHAAKSNIGI